MKKLFLLALLLTLGVGAAQAASAPPWVDMFVTQSPAWRGFAVEDWIQPGGDDWGFAAIRSGEKHVLLAFRRSGGAWTFTYSNADALPQGDLDVGFSEIGAWGFVSGEVREGVWLDAARWEYDGEAWHLERFTGRNGVAVIVEEDALHYTNQLYGNRTGEPRDVIDTRVAIEVDTALSTIVLSDFPRLPEEARERLGEDTDHREELAAQRARLADGDWPLWLGWGEEHGMLGGETLSGGEVIVCARANERVLIRYGDSATGRYAWLNEDALAESPDGVPDLVGNTLLRMELTRDCALCDSTDGGGTLALLRRGDRVLPLAETDGAYYVEALAGVHPICGFLPSDVLAEKPLPSGAQHAVNDLTEIYGYTTVEAAQFDFGVDDLEDRWEIFFAPREHPSWRYRSLTMKNPVRFADGSSPFTPASLPETYPGEGMIRWALALMRADGLLENWDEDAPQTFLSYVTLWDTEITGSLEDALEEGSISAEQAVRQWFVCCYGPESGWPRPLVEWRDSVLEECAGPG